MKEGDWAGKGQVGGERRGASSVLVCRSEKKWSRGRHGRKYNSEMDLREIGWHEVAGLICLRMG